VSSEQQLQNTLRIAARYLNQRDRTTAEVRRYLARAGHDPASIEGVVHLLGDQGYLDDDRYARLFTDDKRRLEQWGNERIRRSLLERGVDREVAEAALAGGSTTGEDELARALSLLRRRFAAPPRGMRERDRALGLLLRRGYGAELALDALAAYSRNPGPPGAAA
jgi:regulatory protein